MLTHGSCGASAAPARSNSTLTTVPEVNVGMVRAIASQGIRSELHRAPLTVLYTSNRGADMTAARRGALRQQVSANEDR